MINVMIMIILYCSVDNSFVFVFLIEDTDFFRTTDDESSVPRFNDNIGIALSEDVDRERGLCFM